ncbi:MAG: hypothetical protein H7A18_07040 [Sinobacteraceae bacterium]|nr:hypothetical protein [Nevskiaceae bacterium]
MGHAELPSNSTPPRKSACRSADDQRDQVKKSATPIELLDTRLFFLFWVERRWLRARLFSQKRLPADFRSCPVFVGDVGAFGTTAAATTAGGDVTRLFELAARAVPFEYHQRVKC